MYYFGSKQFWTYLQEILKQCQFYFIRFKMCKKKNAVLITKPIIGNNLAN